MDGEHRMNSEYIAIGKRVKREREKRGWSQGELAHITQISDSHISSIERGISDFSVKKLTRLANAFQIPSDALLYDEIYASNINIKAVADALSDCSPEEIKTISECIMAIKSSIRQHLQRKDTDVDG